MQIISLAQMLGLGSQTHQSLEIKHMDLPAPQAPFSFLGYYLFFTSNISLHAWLCPDQQKGGEHSTEVQLISFLSACLSQQAFCL